jgi:hypothetical protein
LTSVAPAYALFTAVTRIMYGTTAEESPE